MTGIKGDGNGGLIFSKGLVWVLAVTLPVVFSLMGFGASQLVSVAKLSAQVEINSGHIDELRMSERGLLEAIHRVDTRLARIEAKLTD